MRHNNFDADLKYSLDPRECEQLDRFYHRIFPGIETIESVKDMVTQGRGIDKILWFTSGYTVTIDEKKRRDDYGDILLELWSVWEERKRGWLFTAKCDYIVYVIMPTLTVYLLPVLLLKRAWGTNKELWESKYKKVVAQNKGYQTISIPIPVDLLFGAIVNEMKYKMI